MTKGKIGISKLVNLKDCQSRPKSLKLKIKDADKHRGKGTFIMVCNLYNSRWRCDLHSIGSNNHSMHPR